MHAWEQAMPCIGFTCWDWVDPIWGSVACGKAPSVQARAISSRMNSLMASSLPSGAAGCCLSGWGFGTDIHTREVPWLIKRASC